VVGKLLEPVNIYGPDFFRMHLKILEYLNSIKDFEVVCKFRPNSRRFHYPLKKYLANFSNIRFSEKKLGEEVKDASYCLLDIPSSSLWDVIQLNVPCQSLLYSKFHCRESGLKLFAEYLTLFSDVDSVDEVVREIWEEKRFYSGNFEALGFEEKTNDEIFSLFENTLHGKQGNANL
jgi:hypothetical protein